MPSHIALRPASALLLMVAVAALPAAGAVGVPGSASLPLADLVVDQVWSIVTVPDGDDVARSRVYVSVVNLGSGAAAASSLAWTMTELATETASGAGAVAAYSRSGLLDVPPLAAGGEATLEIPLEAYVHEDAPTPGGFARYRAHALADADSAVDELNESNNAHERDVFGGRAAAPSR